MVNNCGGRNTIGGRKIVPLTMLKSVDKKLCEYYDEEDGIDDKDLPSLKLPFRTPSVNLNLRPKPNKGLEQPLPEIVTPSPSSPNDNNDTNNDGTNLNKSNRGKNSAKNGNETILILDDEEEEDAPIDEMEYNCSYSVVGSASHTASAVRNCMVVDEVDSGSNAKGGIFGVVVDLCSSCNWGGDYGSHDDNGKGSLPS